MKKIRLYISKIKNHYYAKIPDVIATKNDLSGGESIEVTIHNTKNDSQFDLWDVHPEDINEISKFHKVNILFDKKPFHGPLNCMEFLYSKFLGKYNYILLMPVDMPFINSKHIEDFIKCWKKNRDIALIAHSNKMAQPLLGIYPLNQNNLNKLNERLQLGKINFQGWTKSIPFHYYFAKDKEFLNVNSLQELKSLNYY